MAAALSGAGLGGILADPQAFAVCLAVRPHHGAGAPSAGRQEELLDWARLERRVQAFLLAERTAGEGGLPAPALAERVLASGADPVLSFAPAARTAREVLVALRGHGARGVRSILFVTGDHAGAGGGGAPAFDLDSVQLLLLLAEAARDDAGLARLRPGCVVSPFKRLEAEQVWQYEKLARKVESGARFVVTQAGFDPRRFDELRRFCRLRALDVPLLGQVLVADPETARLAREGRIPGLAIPREDGARLAAEWAAGEGGRREALARAGRTVAVLRGIGYRGVVLSGAGLGPREAGAILDEAERRRDDWEDCARGLAGEPRGFSYFLPAERGPLASDRRAPLAPRRRRHPMYLLSWAVDYVAFGSWAPFLRLLTRVCGFCDRRAPWRRALWLAELAAKLPMYGCRMCGDCTLYACGFLCVESGCPKRALNGPCGGSADGWCEVGPRRRRCFWVRVYGRLKGTTASPGFVAPAIPARDRGLAGGCSWINFCLGRDHRGPGARARAVAPGSGGADNRAR